MSLDDYIKKRNFDTSPEPNGAIDKAELSRFVVQRHRATTLHYDLRLEIDGVLKSWAVPKGPSMNPADKRLAIQTEDHPITYLQFEGVIPKGNYGAGKMEIWDKGTYQIVSEKKEDNLQQFENGDLKIEFSGHKLKGRFALVHTHIGKKDNHWLLLKKKDMYATDLEYDAEIFSDENKKESSPSQQMKPMLATPAKKIFNDPNWIYELKWDGYRMLASINEGKVALYSRNGISYTSKFDILARQLKQIPHEVLLDGEVVVLDKKGIPQFQKLQNYDETTSGELRYYVFDMLFLNGHSMLNLPLNERKSLIPEVIEDIEQVWYCDHVEGMGTAFYHKAIEAGMEGIIAKRKDSLYYPGKRSEDWVKVKAVESMEALICGYTNSVKGNSVFGSLILGRYKENELEYLGNCGSGFSQKKQENLLARMKTLKTETSPFKKNINLKGRKPNWLKPELICEVKFSEITQNGLLRHPIFKAIRQDKNPEEIAAQNTIKKNENKNVASSKDSLKINGHSVPISHLDKIYWPASGLRKYDLIDYYLKVAHTLLPYLKDRPQNLHRHPDGISKKGFYQKDNESLPGWVETIKLVSKASKNKIEYFLCQNEASLLYMANLGCIEINPWNSTIENLDKPDYTVIDLDPSENNSFDEIIETALAAHEVLKLAKIKGYCKTSGSRGIHIYIPLAARYTYQEARDFTKLLCYYIQQKLPKLTSMDRAKKNRKNKIYLDYLQNRRGQSLASVYCVRPKQGAPVSTPLEWKELKSGIQISDFNLHTLPQRLEEKGDLFKAVLKEGISMEKALENLNNVN